jgi:hypothetical protein
MQLLGPKIYGSEWNNTDIVPHGQKWYVDDTTNPLMDGLRWVGDVAKGFTTDNPDLAFSQTIPEKISEKIRGIQDAKVVYAPRSDALMVYPYRDYARRFTLEPTIIPVAVLIEAQKHIQNKDEAQLNVLIDSLINARKKDGGVRPK